MIKGLWKKKEKCEVMCPKCSFIQIEPSASVSTYCKKCGNYINTKNHLVDVINFKEEVSKKKKIIEFDSEIRKIEEDEVEISCRECDESQFILEGEKSVICRKCSCLINLKNYVIHNHTNLNISTLGDVFVEENGTVMGTNMSCRNLDIKGQVSGDVNCFGQVRLYEGSVLIGKLSCNNLILEKNVSIYTKDSIVVNNLDFMGNSKGDFVVKNKATIHKNSKLEGCLQASSMEVMPNANFFGDFRTFT